MSELPRDSTELIIRLIRQHLLELNEREPSTLELATCLVGLNHYAAADRVLAGATA